VAFGQLPGGRQQLALSAHNTSEELDTCLPKPCFGIFLEVGRVPDQIVDVSIFEY